jgi:hypothetical protein
MVRQVTPHLRVIATAVAIVLILHSFLFSLAYVQAMAHPDPRLEADQWIDRHIPRTEPIFTSETSYYNRPQVDHMGYQVIDVADDMTNSGRAT